jgi:hypothetical protein
MAKSIRELRPLSETEAGVLLGSYLFETVTDSPDAEGIYARKAEGFEIEDFIDREGGKVRASINSGVEAEGARAAEAESGLSDAIAAEAERAVTTESNLDFFKANKMYTGANKLLSSAQPGELTRQLRFPVGDVIVALPPNSRIVLSSGAVLTVEDEAFKYIPPSGPAQIIYADGVWKMSTIDTGPETSIGETYNADGGVWDVSRFGCVLSDLSDVVGDMNVLPFPGVTLAQAVFSEVSRAKDAEAAISTAIVAETEARASTDAAEQARAITAEEALSAGLAELSESTGSAEAALSAAIEAEVSRAEAAEAVLSDDLAAEVSRAETAEGDIGDAIANEASRALSAEGALDQRVTSEVSRAIGAESVLTEAAEALAALIPAAVPEADGVYQLRVDGGVLSWVQA